MNTMRLAIWSGLLWGALPATLPAQENPDRARQAIELNNRAVELLEGRRFDEAIEILERARRLAGEREKIARNLAEAYRRRGDERLEKSKFAFARADYLHAFEVRPDAAGYRLSAALVIYRQRKYREAREDLERVVERFPRMADAWYLLGDCQVRLKDMIGAVESWKKGAQAEPEHRGIAAALARYGAEAQLEKELYTDQTYNFVFHYHLYRDSVAKHAPTLRRDLEAAFLFCQKLFGFLPRERIHLLLYNREAFHEVTGSENFVGGLYSSYDGRIRIPVNHYTKERASFQRAIRHELAHAFLHSIGEQIPTWLDEGLAQIAEGARQGSAHARLQRTGLLPAAQLWGTFLELGAAAEVRRAYDTALLLTLRLEKIYGRLALIDYIRAINRVDAPGPQELFEAFFPVSFADQLAALAGELERKKR